MFVIRHTIRSSSLCLGCLSPPCFAIQTCVLVCISVFVSRDSQYSLCLSLSSLRPVCFPLTNAQHQTLQAKRGVGRDDAKTLQICQDRCVDQRAQNVRTVRKRNFCPKMLELEKKPFKTGRKQLKMVKKGVKTTKNELKHEISTKICHFLSLSEISKKKQLKSTEKPPNPSRTLEFHPSRHRMPPKQPKNQEKSVFVDV